MPAQPKRPNILFIMSDDHASHAISAYGSRINQTPNIDRIAAGGLRLDNCFCTNSICTPSRATILTGQYGQINGVRTLGETLDGTRPILLPKLLQAGGYQTAIVGKWHLGHGGIHDPAGFDYWNVLPGQGAYHNPKMTEMGQERQYTGYVTDIITDLTLQWLEGRDRTRPFFMMCHHKAPHRHWEPSPKYATLYDDIDIPEPPTFDDDYSNRAAAAAAAEMRIDRDLTPRDLKQAPPPGLEGPALKSWKYQRYIKDYLRCIASIDESVGRLLDYLDREGLADDTIVIYTSDQGFFLGDHGWFDKRFMYEDSLRMPFLIRYPRELKKRDGSPSSSCRDMLLNHDFAPTFLDYAGLPIPPEMQGVTARQMLAGHTPPNWQTSLYYRYWMHLKGHNVYAHYGVRTHRYKLIYYYADGLGLKETLNAPKPPEWELFDLEKDPYELNNVYHHPTYAMVVADLTDELARLQSKYRDEPCHRA